MIAQRKQYTATLCFLCSGDRTLLALKSQKIGAGKRNGYGGHIRSYETIPHCALRELREESGVSTTHEALEKVAIVDFHNTTEDGEQFTISVHVFLVHRWYGEPQETKEMKDPRWFRKDALPSDELMPSDMDWLPFALLGEKMMVEVHLGPNQESLTDGTIINFVDTFPY